MTKNFIEGWREVINSFPVGRKQQKFTWGDLYDVWRWFHRGHWQADDDLMFDLRHVSMESTGYIATTMEAYRKRNHWESRYGAPPEVIELAGPRMTGNGLWDTRNQDQAQAALWIRASLHQHRDDPVILRRTFEAVEGMLPTAPNGWRKYHNSSALPCCVPYEMVTVRDALDFVSLAALDRFMVLANYRYIIEVP